MRLTQAPLPSWLCMVENMDGLPVRYLMPEFPMPKQIIYRYPNRAVVTACELDGSTQHFQNVGLGFEIGIDVHGNNTQATIRNSRIWNYNAHASSATEKFIGIRLRDNSSSTIHNNLVYDCYDTHGTWHRN